MWCAEGEVLTVRVHFYCTASVLVCSGKTCDNPCKGARAVDACAVCLGVQQMPSTHVIVMYDFPEVGGCLSGPTVQDGEGCVVSCGLRTL